MLVVEDEAIIALAIEDMLRELGCEVAGTAMTLGVAEEIAREEAFDAAVLDINLNGDTSEVVAETLRSRGIPFCFSTGYGSADVPLGFEDVPLLQKPYNAASLAAVLERLLA